jgi:hypothetical protein
MRFVCGKMNESHFDLMVTIADLFSLRYALKSKQHIFKLRHTIFFANFALRPKKGLTRTHGSPQIKELIDDIRRRESRIMVQEIVDHSQQMVFYLSYVPKPTKTFLKLIVLRYQLRLCNYKAVVASGVVVVIVVVVVVVVVAVAVAADDDCAVVDNRIVQIMKTIVIRSYTVSFKGTLDVIVLLLTTELFKIEQKCRS